MTIREKWLAAQVEERRFHCDPDAHASSVDDRTKFEDLQRDFFAGVMGIHNLTYPIRYTYPRTITDIGCGPNSLLLHTERDIGQCYAVDPLVFNDREERAYADRGINRVVCPAEEYRGPVTDEVWMYNCLQHTVDPDEVMDTVARHAARVIRLVEWVDVPTDHLHLHTITAHRIWNKFTVGKGFFGWRTYEGLMGEPGRQTRFYGLILVRPDALLP